ncbi:MAG: sulfatase-like hydrolase/transferase [Gammaproteobacteria bacterium]|nr:MAG: sulfatase-like hydrolase/transferase [Gammaproteobacteria bacterium]
MFETTIGRTLNRIWVKVCQMSKPGKRSSDNHGIGMLPAFAIATGGFCLIATAILWDTIVGGTSGIGGKQTIGIIFGAGLVATAVLLSPLASQVRRRLFGIQVFALAPDRWMPTLLIISIAAVLGMFLPKQELLSASFWILLSYVVAICVVLPRRLGLITLLVVLGLNIALAAINAIKIDLTGLPLTMLDVKIALHYPAGLWDALNLPHWTRHLSAAITLVAGAWLVWRTIRVIGDFLGRIGLIRGGMLATGRLLIVVGVLLLAGVHLDRVHAQITNYRGTWEPTGVASLSTQIGTVPFLAYSYRIEQNNSGIFFRDDSSMMLPDIDEVSRAVSDFITFPRLQDAEPGRHPNIVMIMAESTFDPNRAFVLSGKVRSTLFDSSESTAAAGPLFVNAVGGGTWITEFETIVGLDARLFGYSGYYTHSSLSPFVRQSFATYLRDRGYRTWAFLPHSGDFYNYRSAYENYGFDMVLDSQDLGASKGWRRTDVEIIEEFIRHMGTSPEGPFMAHVLLVENHGPHECDDSVEQGFQTGFVQTDDAEPNCALHEYLRRLESTADSVSIAQDYLIDVQKKTGRPFVVLVYGDHQPFSFTGTHMAEYDFDPLRKSAAKNETFFHFLTSIRGRLNCCSEMLPASLIPSVLSAYVANGPSDVYLGVNFWLYQRCGYDFVGTTPISWLTQVSPGSSGADRSQASQGEDRTEDCNSAYSQALAAYRSSGLLLSPRDRK